MQTELPQPTILIGILASVTAIVAVIVGAAVAYLRLFVRGEIHAANVEVMDHIDNKFALKEMMVARFDGLEANLAIRFGAIEGRIEALERRQ